MITLDDSVTRLLLAVVVALPLVGAATALLPAPPGLRGRSPEQAVLRHGVVVTGVVLAATLLLAASFDRDAAARPQAVTDLEWIPALGVRLHLGVDGISLPLLVLTALLGFLCALHAYRRPPAGPHPTALVALLLVLLSGALATFAALDLILFFLAFEMVLIPMYFLIARWGGGGSGPAARRFVVYTLVGSVLMLLGFLLLGGRAGTFDMTALAAAQGEGLGRGVQILVVLAVGLGFAIKTPMWPLHGWLPPAHTAAPTIGSVLLAGVLLKTGTYGLVRVLLPAVPEGTAALAPWLGALAVTGIVYSSLVCLDLVRGGADLKLLIAWSSVGHMGFVLLGIATLTPTGVNAALFANIAHGLITGLLFLLVGAIRERTGTTRLDELTARGSGARLYGRAPRLGALFAFTAMASLGLPGLAGFWGEFLAMLAAYDPAPGLPRPAYLVFLALAGLGTLLTAAWLLIAVRRVCAGDPPPDSPAATEPAGVVAAAPAALPRTPAGPAAPEPTTADLAAAEAPGAAPAADPDRLPDPGVAESAVYAPLAALTLLLGLWPALLLGLTDPAVQALLPGVAR
ncbi:NADH-quinone oxidoreductase subunit M [Streptomyces calidiresistens]